MYNLLPNYDDRFLIKSELYTKEMVINRLSHDREEELRQPFRSHHFPKARRRDGAKLNTGPGCPPNLTGGKAQHPTFLRPSGTKMLPRLAPPPSSSRHRAPSPQRWPRNLDHLKPVTAFQVIESPIALYHQGP